MQIDAVMHFLAHLHWAGLSTDTIAHKMAALCFTAKAVGFPDPRVDLRIRRAMQGWTWGFPKAEETV